MDDADRSTAPAPQSCVNSLFQQATAAGLRQVFAQSGHIAYKVLARAELPTPQVEIFLIHPNGQNFQIKPTEEMYFYNPHKHTLEPHIKR